MHTMSTGNNFFHALQNRIFKKSRTCKTKLIFTENEEESTQSWSSEVCLR